MPKKSSPSVVKYAKRKRNGGFQLVPINAKHQWLIQELGAIGDEESGVELSVVLRSNTHGQQSYGWDGPTKIILGGGSEQLCRDMDIKINIAELAHWRQVARMVAYGLNLDSDITKSARAFSQD